MTDLDADSAAVLAAAKGDVGAFALLFERLGPGAWCFARRLVRDASTAEDAVQDGFLRLLEAAKRGVFDPVRGTARALLFRMIRNACVDGRRRRFREEAPLESITFERADRTPATGLGMDAARTIATLPESWRAALFLRIDQGLSYDEIASALDASLPQVKTWIHRARTALAEKLFHPALAEGGRHEV